MNNINHIQTPFIQSPSITAVKSEEQKVEGFREIFNNALSEVNAAQLESNRLTEKLATGEVNDIHEVMIASQKATLSLQLTVQVRNKVVEAYQEMMRMQV
ncbi:MAG: flagellar hook-basal body complex protein FliE [Bacillus sp. (in: Bacteria)]|nr:flagellar hook-basal body complex protein FliE [Bacillus sp. (in: firmicutes)]